MGKPKSDSFWLSPIGLGRKPQRGLDLSLIHIFHRDLKPDNVMLLEDSSGRGNLRTKLLDFGIAKLAGQARRHSGTVAHSMMGTPLYMSPCLLYTSRCV